MSGPEEHALAATTTAPSPYRDRTAAGTADSGVAARRGPRRARLAVRRIDPWSVLKFTFVFSLALLVVWVVAASVLYGVLNAMGVFESLQNTLGVLTDSGNGTAAGGVSNIFEFRRILGWAALVGAVNVLLFSALSTLGAFLYNLCAELVGGIEVTLTERE